MLNNKSNILIVFILFFLIFFIFQLSSPNILGTDSFFYLKKSILTFQTETIKTLPWLTFSYPSINSAGMHFSFPFFIFPFTKIFNLVLAGKILISLLGGLLFAVFFCLLNKLKIIKPFFWTSLLFLASSTMIFRMNLIRPLSMSVIIFLILIYCTLNRKLLLLGLFSFFYPWLYDGFLVFAAVLTIYSLTAIVINKKIPWKLIAIYLGSTALGMIINPLFPQNIIYLFKANLLSIANILNKAIPVGIEWGKLTLQSLFLNNTILTLILIASIIFLILLKINQRHSPLSKKSDLTLTALGINTLLFLILTFFTQRFIDYLVPLAILFLAYLYTTLFNSQLLPEIKTFLVKLFQKFKKPWLKYYLIFAMIVLIINPFKTLYSSFQNAYPVERYKETAEWLKDNTPEHSIIFHTSWDAFPRLFFWNHHNYYIVGMDPTFMYLYDKELYFKWRHITENVLVCDKVLIDECDQTKNSPADIAGAVKTNFNSEYIWINDYCIYEDFKKFLNDNSDYFEKMIETKDSTVFKIK